MRFMVPQKAWDHSLAKVTKQGMEAAVMGPYYPRGYYTTKQLFGAQGAEEIGRPEPERTMTLNELALVICNFFSR